MHIGFRLALSLIAIGVAYGLWFAHETYSFNQRTAEVANALFIEQTEALRAIKTSRTDKYQERLVLTLRYQVLRLNQMRQTGKALSEPVLKELRYICQQAPEISVPMPGSSANVCAGL